MSSGVYNVFKHIVMEGLVDLLSDTIMVALLNDTHTFAPSSVTNDTWADVSGNEITDGEAVYVTGGSALASKTCVVDNTNNKGVFDSTADVTWAASSIAARYAVLYDVEATPANALILCVDFGSVQTSVVGDFKIIWNTGGILTLS
jgi:hypothetical protein